MALSLTAVQLAGTADATPSFGSIVQEPKRVVSSSYSSIFAGDDDPEPEFELVSDTNIRSKIVSLKQRRGIAGCEKEYTGNAIAPVDIAFSANVCVVKWGDTCHAIVDKFGVHLEEFYFWNPQVNSDCKNLRVGKKYCVQHSNSPDPCKVRHKGMH